MFKKMCCGGSCGESGDETKMGTCCKSHSGSCGGAAYILGVIGAATYYISNAIGFWAGVVGFLKALAWPGFLVFELLNFLV